MDDNNNNNIINPSHYNAGGTIECIDAMEAAFGADAVIIFCHLNAFKYLWRCGKKDEEFNEIGKAQWYLAKEKELWEKIEKKG